MKIRQLILLSSVLIFTTACRKKKSDEISQQSIYTSYGIEYDSSKDSTYVSAKFRHKNYLGTVVELSEPASIKFVNDELNYESIFGNYSIAYSGKITDGYFRYTDANKQEYTNRQFDYNFIGFQSLDTISMENSRTITWEGEQVNENDLVTLHVFTDRECDFEYVSTDEEGDVSVELSREELEDIGHGNAEFVLKRRVVNSNLEESTKEGGRMAVTYVARKNVFIK